ncbi:MAG: NHLP bacteriocin export ABC transporter permease/ATPase subunit [Rivularia sp. (in: cyanobacteria)]
MLQLNSCKADLQVKGNQPLLLDDPQKVWFVKSGTLALFTTKVVDGEVRGNRRYLFSVSAGEVLFGTELFDEWGMVAVAIEKTQLSPLSITHFLDEVANPNPAAIGLLENWIEHLGNAIKNSFLRLPTNLIQPHKSSYLSLQKQQTLSVPTNQIFWVRVVNNNAKWMGFDNLLLEDNSTYFPLAYPMWIEAEDLLEVSVVTTSQLKECDQLFDSLHQLHCYFFKYIDLLVVYEQEQNFKRFQERQKVNHQSAKIAISELTNVLNPQKSDVSFQQGTPLLIAAGAVGRAMGIDVNPPLESEDMHRVSDPLQAIARASGFRTRQVMLPGNWWQQDQGPLLGYTQSDKKPVALLPHKGNKYILFNPENQTRNLVTKATAQTLSLEAQMFYRPLPPMVNSSLDLFKFGIWRNTNTLIGIIVLGGLGTLLGMFTPQAIAMLVSSAIPDANQMLLFQIGFGLLAAAIGKSIFQMSRSILSLRLENSVSATLQPAAWDKLLNLKPAFFRSFSTGDLLGRLLAINQIRAKLSGATQNTLLSAVFSLLNLGLMFAYSIQLTVIGIALTIVAVIITTLSGYSLIRKNRKLEEFDAKITSLVVELINGVSKLRVAAAEERAFAAWANNYSQRVKTIADIRRINDGVSVFNEVLPLISSTLLFWFAINAIQDVPTAQSFQMTGQFLAFNSAFAIFLGGVINLSNTLTDILDIVPLWERAKVILQQTIEADPSSTNPGRLKGKIYLDHITFRYRENGPMIIDDVSIKIEPGEFVAFVGPSGSGKSTIFRLLLGFETPLSGTVYYDGQDLSGLNIQALRRQLGVVLQNGRITSGSIFENISCGALITLDEAWEAARMAGFAEDIEQMPMKMYTVISEGGTNLSGGQRQRLLIARAILLKPKIILMDEATSALDNRTQAIVTESLDKLNATRVVIAHRLSTVRNADRIYVIEAGRLVESGTFDDLLKKGGLFARLAARQID